MTKTLNIFIAWLVTLVIVMTSGCSGTSNTTKNVTPVSPNTNSSTPVQVANLTNSTTPKYNEPMYPANTTEINEPIEKAENITSPEIENAAYVKPPQPAEREASGQSYTPINFNQSNKNMLVPSGSQSPNELKIIQSNTSNTVIVNNST